MSGRSVVFVVLGLLLVAGVAGVAPATANGTSPELSLTIDSTTIENGDKYGTALDPELDIEASVGTNASAARELAEVVVRVNGDFYRNFTTDGDNVSKSVRLDLEHGENRVRVIATDDRDRATSTTFTVIKDSRRPDAFLTAPYGTTPYLPIRDGVVNGSWTTFNVSVLDFSDVPTVRITHRWNDSNDEYKNTSPVTDPGENFSERLFLGLGTNRLRFELEDEYDNTKIYTFDVNVTDAAPPAITLDPYRTRLNRSEFVLSGRVTDDVWVDKARVVATQVDGDERVEKKILRSANYRIEPDRANTSFNKSLFFFEAGTYRVNVTARDVANRTTTRTFLVERLPADRRAVAPEITVNRDRTVVLGAETLFVDGLAHDGQIRRLVVETRAVPTGRTIGYHRIYSGSNRGRVAFDRNVTIGPGLTKVIVRAVDARGGEHARRFFVNGTTRETFVGNTSRTGRGSNASVSLTPLAGGGVGVASAAVQVTGGVAGTRVAVEGPDAVAETANVTVERLAVGLREDANFTLGVTVRDRAAGALPAPTGTRPAGVATVQHSLSAGQVSDATLLFAVRQSYLADRGFDPSNLTVYRKSGGTWTAVKTRQRGTNGTHVRYRADSPGLSVFAIAAGTPDRSHGSGAGAERNSTAGNATDVSVYLRQRAVDVSGTIGNVTAEIDGEPVPFGITRAGNSTWIAFEADVLPAGNVSFRPAAPNGTDNGTGGNATRGPVGGLPAGVESFANTTALTGGQTDPASLAGGVRVESEFAPNTSVELVRNTSTEYELAITLAGGTTREPANATSGSGNATGQADVVVENVTVNATTVAPGEGIAINATLHNEGDADGSYVAGLRVLDLPNVTFAGRRTVTVPAGERRTVTFVHRFNETGTYNVSVNGTRAGPVTVGGGGLLSVFSFLPLRLIGLGLAGVVGLLVVAALARLVLRRTGGDGETSG